MSPAHALLRWFERNRRRLPWRRDRDPYRIWVSEVMCQQTRAETAAPYFERFVARFPTVDELAAADEEEVLGLWSGLGYYRRGRQLHAAAQRLSANGDGIPQTVAGLRGLPGVGEYTAAAIASISFGVAEPVLDGNVVRVLTRRLGFTGDPWRAAGRRTLLSAARELLVEGRPGDSNQAMMELGATLCRPRAPRCPECPLLEGCVAAAAGQQESLPRPRKRRAVEQHRRLVAVVLDGGRALLYRRAAGDELLAGLWEMPWVEWAEDGAAERRLGERYGGAWRLGESHGWVRHAITHRALRIEVRKAVRIDGAETVAEGPECGWFGPAELARLAVPSLVGKVLRRAGAAPGAKAPAGARRSRGTPAGSAG